MISGFVGNCWKYKNDCPQCLVDRFEKEDCSMCNGGGKIEIDYL